MEDDLYNYDLDLEKLTSWKSNGCFLTGVSRGELGSVYISDRVGNCIDRVKSEEEGYYVPFVGESEGGNGFQNITVGDVLQLGNERLGVYISKVNENMYAVALFGNPEMAFYNSDGLILDDNFEPMEKDNRKIMGFKTKC